MRHAGARAHHLDVACGGASFIAQAVAVSDRAGPDVRDDFHVAVRMRRETRLRRDGIVVPHADRAPAHASRVAIVGEAEMMAGIEPAVIGMA